MEHSIEIITSTRPDPGQIKAAILDFDGTLSTLRHGWEDVMEPLMVEMICGPDHKDDGTVIFVVWAAYHFHHQGFHDVFPAMAQGGKRAVKIQYGSLYLPWVGSG